VPGTGAHALEYSHVAQLGILFPSASSAEEASPLSMLVPETRRDTSVTLRWKLKSHR